MKTRVSFWYDEEANRWEPVVDGVADETEARQAFSAVVLTCQYLLPSLLDKAKVEGHGGFKESGSSCPRFYKITPAISSEQDEYHKEMDRLAAMIKAAEEAGVVVDVMPKD